MLEEGILSRAKRIGGKSMHHEDIWLSQDVEVKVHPRWPRGGVEVNATVSLISALDVGKWSTARPGHSTPNKETRYPFYRRLGVGPRAGADGCGKISPPPGFDHWTVQPVASRYTD